MTCLTGTGRHRAQIVYFFWMQIGPRTSTGVALIEGSRLDRMRQCLGLSGELKILLGLVLICICRWKRRRMRCWRLPTTSTDPKRPQGHLRATNRQDSIDAPARDIVAWPASTTTGAADTSRSARKYPAAVAPNNTTPTKNTRRPSRSRSRRAPRTSRLDNMVAAGLVEEDDEDAWAADLEEELFS